MSGPLIVQSDRTVLLEVAHPDAEDARHDLAVFAELERAPEHMHTYRITRLGLWNACAAGHTSDSMIATLERYSRFPVPRSVAVDIADTVARYGRLVIERDAEGVLILRSTDPAVLAEIVQGQTRRSAHHRHPAGRRPHDRTVGTRPTEARAGQAGLARGRPRRIHARHAASDRPR